MVPAERWEVLHAALPTFPIMLDAEQLIDKQMATFQDIMQKRAGLMKALAGVLPSSGEVANDRATAHP